MASEAPAATDDDDSISCRDTLDAVAARFRAIHKRENASSAAVTCPPMTPDRSAAVLIGLFADHKHDGGRVHVLLTKRSSDLRQHGGEVALPGGKFEAGDGDLVSTALRESEEEIGLARDDTRIKPLCCLPAMVSKHLLMVTPVVAIVPAPAHDRAASAATTTAGTTSSGDGSFAVCANPDEVEAVFSAPLDCFLSNERHMSQDVRWGDVPFRMHFFTVTDAAHPGKRFTVWGLTASALIKAAIAGLGRQPDFQVTSPEAPPRETLVPKADGSGVTAQAKL